MHRDGPRSGAMSLLLGLAVMIANPCWAQDQAGKAVGGPVASPIAACKEASATALDAGFGLRCGTGIPAGIFLGSYVAAIVDSIGDCVKRCVGNESCTAFSLTAHEASSGTEKPAAPICTLYGSAERFVDEPSSVAGVRVNVGAVAARAGGGARHYSHRRLMAVKKSSKSASHAVPDDAKVELTPDMTALQPVYFATDRVPATGAPLEASFTAGRASTASYGLTVPMWFCPVRTEETSAQYAAARTVLGHDLSNIDDLNRYLASYFGGGFVIMNHNLWVSRKSTMAYVVGSLPDPNVPPTVANTDPATYGWPLKTTDRACPYVPFISDACFSGYATGNPGGPNVDNINISGANNASSLIAAKKTSGHVFNRSLSSITVNCTYADGHVASHKKQLIRGVYIGDSNSGWFY